MSAAMSKIKIGKQVGEEPQPFGNNGKINRKYNPLSAEVTKMYFLLDIIHPLNFVILMKSLPK